MVVLSPGNARYGGQAVSKRRVVIASDHAGFELKQALIAELRNLDCEPVDLGAHGPESVDYPDFAEKLAAAMADGEADTGVLVCGTGIGISIAANRHSHIRAGLAHDVTSARLMREHNDANVLALGERLIGIQTARDCLKVFLETSFEGGRHQRRVDKLSPPRTAQRPA